MRGTAVAAVVVTALLAAACSGDGDSTAPAPATRTASTTTTRAPATGSPGCASGSVPTERVSDRTMSSGEVDREFQLSVPDGYDGTTPVPVVLMLHALTVHYAVVPVMSGFPEIAEQYDFVGVAPSGRVHGTTPYWLAAPASDNYDLEFVADLLDLLETELCVDTSRVFATGMSNGGQMSSLLACRLADRITAVAPVAGVEFSGACDGATVPVMAFHGTADPFVPYAGGGLDAATIADQHYWMGAVPAGLPVHDGVDGAMARWAAHNGCDPEPLEEPVAPDVRRRWWTGCNAETVLYVVVGGGHTWPGHPVPGFDGFGPTATGIDATALMFAFFLGPGA